MSGTKSKTARGLRAALFLLALIPPPAGMGLARAQSAPEVWLETASAEGKVEITALVRGGPAAALRYELRSEKTGVAGRSTTRQSGKLTLSCCEPVTLSHLSLGLNAGDRFDITLELFEGDKLLAGKTLSYPP